MPFITLTSDMGNRDYYVGALKGFIYKRLPEAKIIDLSHNIRPFNIIEAAFCVSNVIEDFPDDTIHILAVNSDPNIDINMPSNRDEWPMVMYYRKQYFVGIDNGVFSLILQGNSPDAFYRMTEAITIPGILRFPAKNLLAKIACQIAEGNNLNDLGELVDSCKTVSDLIPVVEPNLIRGHVLHIDVYGNLITNIREDLFKRIGGDEPFIIYFRSKDYFIDKIHNSYNEVPHGERVAIFNSNNLLEIAINMGVHKNGGGANTLFGLKERDIIRIEFTPPGSKETIDSLF
jgi:S-adenosyl-L-methionine hydrolase (adenosine-forming)